MSDLDINIALAKAMGWVEISELDYINMRKTGFVVASDGIICAYNFCLLDFKFDYRDPVIFVAICKRWGLDANFHKNRVDGFVSKSELSQLAYRHEAHTGSMERAAALVVIEYAKRETALKSLGKKGVK